MLRKNIGNGLQPKSKNKPLKRLSLYLFLILFSHQTPSLGSDIGDFQIEGMSVGDSLSDFFSEEEIKNTLMEMPHANEELVREVTDSFMDLARHRFG